MFIKRTRGGSKEKPIYYLQLVQSYRDESGKPKHRVICTLGREEDWLCPIIPVKIEKWMAFMVKYILWKF